jgi:hypothetical protein
MFKIRFYNRKLLPFSLTSDFSFCISLVQGLITELKHLPTSIGRGRTLSALLNFSLPCQEEFVNHPMEMVCRSCGFEYKEVTGKQFMFSCFVIFNWTYFVYRDTSEHVCIVFIHYLLLSNVILFSRFQVGPLFALIKAEVPWSARRGNLSEKERVLKKVKG